MSDSTTIYEDIYLPYQCPFCGAGLEFLAEAAGKLDICPHCKSDIELSLPGEVNAIADTCTPQLVKEPESHRFVVPDRWTSPPAIEKQSQLIRPALFICISVIGLLLLAAMRSSFAPHPSPEKHPPTSNGALPSAERHTPTSGDALNVAQSAVRSCLLPLRTATFPDGSGGTCKRSGSGWACGGVVVYQNEFGIEVVKTWAVVLESMDFLDQTGSHGNINVALVDIGGRIVYLDPALTKPTDADIIRKILDALAK